ncbi:hypothetical protein M9458_043540, partial [Cirrhinus mrigala]
CVPPGIEFETSALSTTERSQEGTEGDRADLAFLPPEEPDDQVMLPHRLPLYGVVV